METMVLLSLLVLLSLFLLRSSQFYMYCNVIEYLSSASSEESLRSASAVTTAF